ncbi:MAG: glycosyl transferase [Oscillospiraceae bacterium]|nr:glycosyl transferase [Oscillospiraceae bacterium]
MGIKSKVNTLIGVIFDKNARYRFLANRGRKKDVPAEEFVKIRYRIDMGKELDLENPVTYTEKLQWLKLYDHRPEYTTMVDKYGVKEYVSKKIGEKYVIPLLGVWEKVDDIDFNSLPERFVLKTTHDSGGIVICKDKSKLDIHAAKRKLSYFMKRNYYDCNREWPYKNVKHRIIAEEYMEDSRQGELRDYKFFTFGGEPKVLYIAQGRGKGEPTVADFFDMDYNHLPFTIDHDMAPVPPEKPQCFEEMKELAAKLSAGTPQLRVDFYEVDGKVYFGEMTFFHCSGLAPFRPEAWDKKFGDWVVLPEKRI